jgi:hypothetical protein
MNPWLRINRSSGPDVANTLRPSLNMRLSQSIAIATVAVLCCALGGRAVAADADGVAVAVVYDTSGSMSEPVVDGKGGSSPKYLVANHALVAIAQRLQGFATNTATGTPRTIYAGLYVFQGSRARPAVAFGKFDAAAFTHWAQHFAAPGGGTPLGNALRTAGTAVLNSGLTRKHVLIITDGMNTLGPDPASVLPQLQREAAQKETALGVHFVAFDVDAKVFDGVKKLGATVVAAANEAQLNQRLEFILEKRILLEDEEPPKKP